MEKEITKCLVGPMQHNKVSLNGGRFVYITLLRNYMMVSLHKKKLE